MRENYRKAISKRNTTKSGLAPTEHFPTCAYFKQLPFLSDTIGNRPTCSCVSYSTAYLLSSPQYPPSTVHSKRPTSFPVTTVSARPSHISSKPTSTPVTISTITISPPASVISTP